IFPPRTRRSASSTRRWMRASPSSTTPGSITTARPRTCWGALRGRRDKVVLMTKVCTHGRSGRLALSMLEESLRRLQTDHLDLWQIHGIVYDNDPDLAYAKGGVLEAFDRAKQQGKTRFVGFTGHKNPAFHLRMLELGYPFDSVQMPLNPFDASYFSFAQTV